MKTKKNDGNLYKQINLFNDLETNVIKKKPRNKKTPIGNKNTDASAAAFGWEFQIVAAIALSLHNIENLKVVEIEGNTEDIELYFDNKDTEYIQAKAVQKNPLDAADNKKAKDAMNTLINTSNITKGKYSKLVYVVNFRNPLNLSEELLSASWKPSMDRIFVRPYTSLSKEGKVFIDERIKMAQDDLGKKYLNTLDYFDVNRLYVATILFDSNNQDDEQYSVLRGMIEQFFDEVHISKTKVERVKNMFVAKYLAGAGSKENGKRHKKITKEILIWRIIFETIDEVPNSFFDNIPMGIVSEVETYENDFIRSQSENGEIMNKVFGGLTIYAKGRSITPNLVCDFISENWTEYKDIFPLDDDDEVQQYGIKLIMLRIINGKRTIDKIKKKVNLK